MKKTLSQMDRTILILSKYHPKKIRRSVIDNETGELYVGYEGGCRLSTLSTKTNLVKSEQDGRFKVYYLTEKGLITASDLREFSERFPSEEELKIRRNIIDEHNKTVSLAKQETRKRMHEIELDKNPYKKKSIFSRIFGLHNLVKK